MKVFNVNKYKYTLLGCLFLIPIICTAQIPKTINITPQPTSTQLVANATSNTIQVKRKQQKAKYFVPQCDSLSVISRYAQFMQVNDTCQLLPQLYGAIDEWIGTPYRYGRNSKINGTDCSGFVGEIFKEIFAADLPRSTAAMINIINTKQRTELQEGDLIIFNYYGRRNSHVGIYLQNGWFVHASTVYGVTLSNLNTPFYVKKFSKGGSVNGLDIQQLIAENIAASRNVVILNKLSESIFPIYSNPIKKSRLVL